jgi:hypothetical protein
MATQGLQKQNVSNIQLQSDCDILLIASRKVESQHVIHLHENYSATQMYNYYKKKYKWSSLTLQKYGRKRMVWL